MNKKQLLTKATELQNNVKGKNVRFWKDYEIDSISLGKQVPNEEMEFGKGIFFCNGLSYNGQVVSRLILVQATYQGLTSITAEYANGNNVDGYMNFENGPDWETNPETHIDLVLETWLELKKKYS